MITFHSIANATGTDTFTLWLVDSGGLTDSIQITIQVTNVNDAPWISEKSIIIANDTWNQWENFADFEFYLKSFENDVDHLDSQLTWTIDSGYTLFQLSGYDALTDIMTISSISNAVGYESFTLRLSDAGGLSDTVVVYINVTGILEVSISSLNENSIYFNDEQFDIQVYVESITSGSAIDDATISYSIMGSVYTTNRVNDDTGGYYTITIFGWEQPTLGDIDITIQAVRTDFTINTTVFSYQQYRRTTQSISETSFEIYWGDNATFSPYFFNNISVGITGAILEWDPSNPPFLIFMAVCEWWFVRNRGRQYNGFEWNKHNKLQYHSTMASNSRICCLCERNLADNSH